jgi:dihydrofolate reductase
VLLRYASCERAHRVFKDKCDLLLGRKAYELFAGYWPYYDESAPDGGIAKLFKDIKKYVVSRSGDVDTSWQGSVLLRDIADVKRLREGDGPNRVARGSTELVHALLANDRWARSCRVSGFGSDAYPKRRPQPQC